MSKNYRMVAEPAYIGVRGKSIGGKKAGWYKPGMGAMVFIAAVAFVLMGILGAFAREADDKAVLPAPVVDETAWNPVVRLSNGCTGFYIGDGVFLSAGHCMGEAKAWSIGTDNAKGAKKTIAVDTMIYSNPADWSGQDTAIIYTNPILTKGMKPVSLDCSGTVWPIQTPIATEGFPEDYGRNYTVGVISAKASPWKAGKGGWYKDLYRTQLPVSYGNSGGPVFNTDTGKVIGVLVGVLPNNRSLSAVQPIDFACRVLGLTPASDDE